MMSDNRPVRVGIVGAGANTRGKHIPGLRKLGGVEIISVANRHHESSERVAREFDIPTVYDSWQELVAAPNTDAIVISAVRGIEPITRTTFDDGLRYMAFTDAVARSMAEERATALSLAAR